MYVNVKEFGIVIIAMLFSESRNTMGVPVRNSIPTSYVRCSGVRETSCTMEVNSCKNGGFCLMNTVDCGVICKCAPGFYGTFCDGVVDRENVTNTDLESGSGILQHENASLVKETMVKSETVSSSNASGVSSSNISSSRETTSTSLVQNTSEHVRNDSIFPRVSEKVHTTTTVAAGRSHVRNTTTETSHRSSGVSTGITRVHTDKQTTAAFRSISTPALSEAIRETIAQGEAMQQDDSQSVSKTTKHRSLCKKGPSAALDCGKHGRCYVTWMNRRSLPVCNCRRGWKGRTCRKRSNRRFYGIRTKINSMKVKNQLNRTSKYPVRLIVANKTVNSDTGRISTSTQHGVTTQPMKHGVTTHPTTTDVQRLTEIINHEITTTSVYNRRHDTQTANLDKHSRKENVKAVVFVDRPVSRVEQPNRRRDVCPGISELSFTCMGHGTCRVMILEQMPIPRCVCDSGWVGNMCHNRCAIRCLNGGVCKVARGYQMCQCRRSYTGRRCARDIRPRRTGTTSRTPSVTTPRTTSVTTHRTTNASENRLFSFFKWLLQF